MSAHELTMIDHTLDQRGDVLRAETFPRRGLTLGRMLGTRMLLTPPSLTLILRQRLESVCGEVLLTFLAWTHWVAIPRTVSPTRFTSAVGDTTVRSGQVRSGQVRTAAPDIQQTTAES